MGKSTIGPDMTDCMSYLRAMEQQNECFTTVLLLFAGPAASPICTISVLSVSNGHLGGAQDAGIGTGLMWPNRDNRTFEGALYRALVEHDKAWSERAFCQRTL